MGNKIIFERWRRFLAEAELQYSKSAAQEVENLVRQKYSPGANQEQLETSLRFLRVKFIIPIILK
jgi:hypothetical protein